MDIHFRLLREDFIQPLREAVLAYRTQQLKQQTVTIVSSENYIPHNFRYNLYRRRCRCRRRFCSYILHPTGLQQGFNADPLINIPRKYKKMKNGKPTKKYWVFFPVISMMCGMRFNADHSFTYPETYDIRTPRETALHSTL